MLPSQLIVVSHLKSLFINIQQNYYQEMDLKADFQVIVTVEDDDGRMFPLTQDLPKCLLPIANRPLLAYTLDSIRNSGAVGA